MRILIIHYHLNPGGVTRVIESQVKALQIINPEVSVQIITGSCLDNDFGERNNVKVLTDKTFDYLNEGTTGLNALLAHIIRVIENNFKSGDIIHVHNLNLGKNPLLTLAVYRLASKGCPVINHAHDFSEDRPKNQSFLKHIIEDSFSCNIRQVMYPYNKNYGVAVLNSYDLQRVRSYGIAEEQSFLVPNPIAFQRNEFNEVSDKTAFGNIRVQISKELRIETSKKIITYPVRVIKRKNIGEFILLSALFAGEANWIVTQAPQNPQEKGEYIKWKNFCRVENIPIVWEAGNKVNFEDLIKVSDFCITTSVQEGFGMVFLEPWLLGTPVTGRNIPQVTSDLKASGIELPLLYNNLWVGNEKEIYQQPLEQQMNLVRKCKTDSGFRKELFRLNPFLKNFLHTQNQNLINQNKAVILKEFSLEKYGNRLYEIYRRIIKRP